MKKILFAAFLFFNAGLFAQAPELQWQHSINGNSSSDDYPQKSVMDATGNVYIVGRIPGNTIFLVKYDNNGNQIYRTTYFGPGIASADGNDLVVDNNGNAYVAGSADNGLRTTLVVKFDAQGNKAWEHYLPFYYYTNYFNGFNSCAFDNPANPTALYAVGSYNDSIIVEKINIGTGAGIWSKMFEGGKALKVKADNNGNPLVCGLTRANFNTNGEDGYIAKITSSGSLAWRQTFNGTADTSDAALDIEPLTGGGLILAGSVIDSTANGKPWIKFARMNVAGQFTWGYDLNFPGFENHMFTGLTLNNTQSRICLSYDAIQTCCGFKTISFVQSWDMAGNQEFFNTFSNPPAQVTTSADLRFDNFGNVYVLGATKNGFGAPVAYVWKTNSMGVTKDTGFYSSFPVGGARSLQIDNSGHPFATLRVYGLQSDAALVKFNNSCVQDWEVIYDGKDDFPDQTTGLVVDNAGNAYVAGSTLNGLFYNSTLAKYSAAGNLLWQNSNPGIGAGVAIDAQANLYFLNNTNPASLLKYDSAGNQVMSTMLPIMATVLQLGPSNTTYIGGGSDAGQFAPPIPSRDFAVAVHVAGVVTAGSNLTNSPGFITNPAGIVADNNSNLYVGGVVTDLSHLNANVIVQKFNASAQSTWYYQLPGIDSAGFELAHTANIMYNAGDGHVYVVCSGTPQGNTIGAIHILKIDANTNAVTTYTYDASGTTSYTAYDAVVSSSNEILVTGRFSNFAGYGMFVQKWDNVGNLQWERTFMDNPSGNFPYGGGQSIAVDAAGNIFAAGFLETQGTFSNEYTYTVKISAAGNTLWTKVYPGPIAGGNGRGTNIAITNNSRIYVAGNVQTGPYAGYNVDISLLKYCDMVPASVSYTGSTSICQNSSIVLNANVSGSGAVNWNNGVSAGTNTVSSTGNYYFTYSEMDGCAENSDTVTINIKGAPNPVQICMVTVDDSSKHNLILWDKTAATPDVIGFNIYREDLTNIYHLVGSVPMTSLSEYVDMDANANPNSTTKRYKLTTVDSCGNESAMSNYHNTIYIVSSGGGQFSWNQLYTIENTANPVVQYFLLRDDYNTNAWHAVDSTAGTQFNINDVQFATFQPTANWRVVTQWNIQCTPTARQINNSVQTAVVKSKSNITNNRVVSVATLNDKNVIAYPNPAQSQFTVTVPAGEKTTVKLNSLLGEEVYSSTVSNGGDTQIDVSKLAAGTYLLQVSNENGKFMKRIVKE